MAKKSIHSPTGRMAGAVGALSILLSGALAAAKSTAAPPQVEAARGLIARTGITAGGIDYAFDALGLIEAVFAGIPGALPKLDGNRDNMILELGIQLRSAGKLRTKDPKPGDIVFFDNTFDANADNRWNDHFTHAGIVESIDADGTVSFIHRSMDGIVRDFFNLAKPGTAQDAGKNLNSFLRLPSALEPDESMRLAGRLVAGFATLP